MRILFLDYESFGGKDIVTAINALGHELELTQMKPKNNRVDNIFTAQFTKFLSANTYDIIFSFNFYPVVAEVCHYLKTKYVSWVYDSPQILLYHKSIFYPTNYVFLFDKTQYLSLANLNVNTVYHLPLAANTSRLDDIIITEQDKKQYTCDVSFVGSLYNEAHNFYDRMEPKLSEYAKGYLEALMQAQKNVYGYFFLEEVLNNNPIMKEMQLALPYEPSSNSFAIPEYGYAHYFLGRKLANIEREEILSKIAGDYNLYIYSTGDTSHIPHANNKGTISYYEDAPKAFKLSKINLNITLRTIQSGIPLRAFDIMGSGGFLLTNYQSEFLNLFTPEEDFVYYESQNDMLDKINYYLTHDDERSRIAMSGYKKIKKHHTYIHRFKEILDTIGPG